MNEFAYTSNNNQTKPNKTKQANATPPSLDSMVKGNVTGMGFPKKKIPCFFGKDGGQHWKTVQNFVLENPCHTSGTTAHRRRLIHFAHSPSSIDCMIHEHHTPSPFVVDCSTT
jgi:hypothetical protein